MTPGPKVRGEVDLREGMVTVYDDQNRYLGCMGIETWKCLLEEEAEQARAKVSRTALWWHRIKGGWRCAVGLHRLRGYQDCGDGVTVAPASPYGAPGPGQSRKCDWCGARWRAAYDGLSPFWQRCRP